VSYPACVDCAAAVKPRHRDRCHVCHRRAARAALKRPCSQCARLRHLRPNGLCAGCVRAATPCKPPKTITCRRCGQQRRNGGHGLCNRCNLADPDRPFRYAASIAARLPATPDWWDEFAAFVITRRYPGGAVDLLRQTARILTADPHATPQQILQRCTDPAGSARVTGDVLTAFFTAHGLVLHTDTAQRRTATSRQRYLDAIPTPLAGAVAEFNQAALAERDQARRSGRHPLSDTTLQTRLRILRDLATHLNTHRQVISWTEVTTTDLEGFLARTPQARHQQTYVLRHFFAFARHRKLILIDPAQPLRLGAQPGFTGTVLDPAIQRILFRRWTNSTTHPHERLTGLLCLLHAASNLEIRTLTVTDLNPTPRTLHFPGRPFPTPLDPASWDALDACLRHREALNTLNPHLVVTGATRTRDTPADSSYLSRRLAPAGTTPAACRQTRIAQLVTDLDPKLTATVLGMHDTGLVRYLADNVDHDRLQPTRH
jgi:hypothetical protein